MHHDPIIDTMAKVRERIVHRIVYYIARIVVVILFASIIFSPRWLKIFLNNPFLLGATIFGTLVLGFTLLIDLLTERQRNLGSLIVKYAFLTLSVILAFGLFYYLNATMIQPPGIYYMADDHLREIERDVFYLSATTYFTIGYGDVVPLGTMARTAAVGEAFMGSLINLIVLGMAFQNMAKIQLGQNESKI